jgi:hypothetical protein
MLRYTMSFFEPVGIELDNDGEYVLYEQHIEEVNRIRAEARAEAADRGWQALKKTGCLLGITYTAFLEAINDDHKSTILGDSQDK